MTSLEREIRKYNIMASIVVRGEGSLHSNHPNRALWDICGKPSIQWAIEAAKGSKYINKIAIITESEEIKKVLRKIEGIILIDRPLWTSYNMPRDYTQGEFSRKKPRSRLSPEASIYNSPFEYALYYLEQTEGFISEVVINFFPSSPLVTSQTFDRLIIKFFEDESAGSVFCAYPISPGLVMINHKTGRPFEVLPKIGTDRQECPLVFALVSPYLRGSPSRLESGPLLGKQTFIEISAEEGLDIHDQEDLFLGNCYMKRRLIKEGKEVKWNIGQDYRHKILERKKEEKQGERK